MPATATITPLPIRPARPTVEIDGQRIDRLESALLALDVADSVEGMAHAELTFGNWGGDTPGFQFFDRRTLEFGKPITLKLGDDALFVGRIGALCADYPDGGPPTVTVLAEDRLQDLRMTRRSRSFEQATLADVAQRIAGEHGLVPRIDFDAVTQPLIAQVNQSDLALLHDLARREDATVWVDNRELHLARLRPDTQVDLRWAGSLREFHVEADLAGQRTALVASGWDVSLRTGVSYRADRAAIGTELGSDDGGAAILAATLGDRVDCIAHAMPRNQTEARAVAEGTFRHVARAFVRGEGVAEANGALRVGARLALTGLGPLFDGFYRATAIRHRFDQAAGLRTEFRCERPGIGRPA
ncbi:MAG: contractile injection system protein, VgrG/Pvc8 family [Acetobacteraceae bacterium]|nr:contractile injection system protein, VgrG/Pvc8 family [Acetobacteraceae bacterium]